MKKDFEQRKQNRINRYKDLSVKNEKLSDAQFKRASDLASVIPFGQPILIGHHSEKRDRNYRKKISSLNDKALKSDAKAKYYAERAVIAESNDTISSDDPQAVIKLTEKLNAMIELQSLMKAVNKIIRNAKLHLDQKVKKLIDLNIPEQYANELLQPDRIQGMGFPHYKLTNNNANIKRVKDRIRRLEKIEKMESSEVTINGVRIFTNVEANRLQLFFPGKPSQEIRTELKRYGFRWSPSEGAWQRQISNGAFYSAKEVVSRVRQ